MMLKSVSKWTVIMGTLSIWLIKFVIRPFVHIPYVLKPVVGIAPNLIGSFLLPFGAYWLFKPIFRLQNTLQLTFTCAIGLLLVIINEFLQRIPIFGRTFDYLDIFSSVVGVFIGHFVFAKLMRKSTVYQQSLPQSF